MADGKDLGTNVIEWENVCREAMAFCQNKKDQHRFDGQGNLDTSRPPTYVFVGHLKVGVLFLEPCGSEDLPIGCTGFLLRIILEFLVLNCHDSTRRTCVEHCVLLEMPVE